MQLGVPIASEEASLTPMVADAYRFIIPVLLLAAVAGALGWIVPCLILLILSAFVCFFFRNPERLIPEGVKLIVSPADGKIVRISPGAGADSAGVQAISIFLSVFDVHVNRSPIRGELESLEYKRGKFKVAYDDEASRVNEQNILTIRGEGNRVIVKQIAGLIARRVVCWKEPGYSLARGELIGLIRFGSRVDVLLPQNAKVRVKVGDRVKGGSSILGEFA